MAGVTSDYYLPFKALPLPLGRYSFPMLLGIGDRVSGWYIHHHHHHHHQCRLVEDRRVTPCPLATSVEHNADKGIPASSRT